MTGDKQSNGAASGSSKGNGSMPFDDRPCENCGRYGVMAGQMVRGADDTRYCSADCGWSFMLRGSERQSNNNSTRKVSRRSRNERLAHNGGERQNGRRAAGAGAGATRSGSGSGSSSSGRPGHSHARTDRIGTSKPPKIPSIPKQSNSNEMSAHGHAMFDYSMRFFTEWRWCPPCKSWAYWRSFSLTEW